MFWFKACPRCAGDLVEGSDVYGKFVSCLRCGHELTFLEEAVLHRPVRIPVQSAPAREKAVQA